MMCPTSSSLTPADELSRWAFIVFADFTTRRGTTVKSVLPSLVTMALDEPWHFGKEPDPLNPFPILENYLRITFFRVRREGKLLEATGPRSEERRVGKECRSRWS